MTKVAFGMILNSLSSGLVVGEQPFFCTLKSLILTDSLL
jgi:hypothetical protein